MNLILLPAAVAEAEEAATWYDERRAGLGQEFLADIQAVADRLRDHPNRWPILHGRVRCAHLSRFPYVLYYRVDLQAVVVTRCRHLARRPL
jgi:plasmid stabilization system protein ParE